MRNGNILLEISYGRVLFLMLGYFFRLTDLEVAYPIHNTGHRILSSWSCFGQYLKVLKYHRQNLLQLSGGMRRILG